MHDLKKILALMGVLGATPLSAGNCSWTTTPNAVAFGTYSVFSVTNTSTATSFSFRCTPNQYARIKLSRGSSGVFTPSRTMMSAGNTAAYNVYLEPAGLTIWGDTTAGSVSYDVYNSTPQNKDFIDNLYGVMPAAQDLAVGSYTDTLFAVLEYSGSSTGPWTSLPNVAVSVSATVAAECRVDAFNLDFGTYDPFGIADLSQSTALKVYCTRNSAPVSVVLNNGSFAAGLQKRMSNGAGTFLNYSAVLGSTSGSSTSSVVPIAGGFPLNGGVPAQQDVAVGLYRDTLVASVNY